MEKTTSDDSKEEEKARRRERCKDPRWLMCNYDAIGSTSFELHEANKRMMVKEAIKALADKVDF